MAQTNKSDPRRAQLIKLIHIAKSSLHMDDDSYRQMLANIPQLEGATSVANLTVTKLDIVLEHMKNKGFKVTPKAPGKVKSTRKLADDPQSKKIRSLWLSLHEAGKVRDPSETALNHYISRMTRIDQLQWLSNKQASTVIESLKSWLER